MKGLILAAILLLASHTFGQVNTIDRSDTIIHVVQDYRLYDHWMLYPATSAVYVPPCIYRIVPADTLLNDLEYQLGFAQFQLVEQYGKYGIVNSGDTIIIPIVYDSLINISNSRPQVFIAERKAKFALLNAENEILLPFEYDRIHLLTNGYYSGFMSSSLQVEKGKKKGLNRMDGSVELTCKYDYIDIWCEQVDCPKEGIQYYVGIDGKYGYINSDESIAIQLKYEALNADGFSGLIKAKIKGKVGLIDTLENFILPPIYEALYSEYMERFPNLTAFKNAGKWGLMRGEYSEMQVVLENRFDSVMTDYAFKDHFIIINGDKWGLADTNGKVVIEPQFQEILAMEDGTFAYKKDDKWGFMNSKGFIHCSPRYDAIYDNIKDWCLVTKGDGFGFCKTAGTEIVAPVYHAPYWDDYLHWGELISRGHIVLTKGEGYENCKMGVIDSNGRVILPFEYDCRDELVYNFGTCFITTKNDQQVLIDPKGKEVYLGTYDRIEKRRDGLDYFFIMKGDKVGLVAPDGKLLSTPKYDQIDYLEALGEGMETSGIYFRAEENGKIGVLDSSGRIILEPIYEDLVMKDKDIVLLLSDSNVKFFNLISNKYEPFLVSEIYYFNGQIGAFYGAGGKVLFIDSKGKRVNSDIYDRIYLLGSDSSYFEVIKSGRRGICDAEGKLLIEPEFSKIKYWDGEFGAGKSGNKYCFFDAKGDTIVGYRYNKVKGVYKDFVCVKVGENFGVVTKQGKTVIGPRLQEKLNFELLKEFGLTRINENYKWGVVNGEMKTVLNPKYDTVKMLKVHNKVYIIVNIKEAVELYDSEGNRISNNTFSNWEQNEAGELFLSNGLMWFKLSERGTLEEVVR